MALARAALAGDPDEGAITPKRERQKLATITPLNSRRFWDFISPP
jgi:hypothetical protein